MTKESLERLQGTLLRHPQMQFVYMFIGGGISGYLPRKEFLNLNPFQPEFKIYQQTLDARVPRLRPVTRSEICDMRMAQSNTYI